MEPYGGIPPTIPNPKTPTPFLPATLVGVQYNQQYERQYKRYCERDRATDSRGSSPAHCYGERMGGHVADESDASAANRYPDHRPQLQYCCASFLLPGSFKISSSSLAEIDEDFNSKYIILSDQGW